jgi:hypothetical protein
VSVLKIPARTTCPVRLATAIGAKHKSVSTIGNIDHPQLFAQPGLVVWDHQGDVTIMLQNMSDVDIEIQQCFFNVGTLKESIFFDHFLWPISQSSLHINITNYISFMI